MAVQYIIPTGVGTLNQFTSFAGGDKWLDVDDPPGSPDDDASYLLFDGAGGSGATQLWTFAAPTIPAEAFEITVHNHLRTRSMGTGGSNRRVILRVNSTNYFGSNVGVSLAVGWINIVGTFLVNPATTQAWTVDQINGVAGSNNLVQFGFEASSLVSGEFAHASQNYLSVTFRLPGQARRFVVLLRG